MASKKQDLEQIKPTKNNSKKNKPVTLAVNKKPLQVANSTITETKEVEKKVETLKVNEAKEVNEAKKVTKRISTKKKVDNIVQLSLDIEEAKIEKKEESKASEIETIEKVEENVAIVEKEIKLPQDNVVEETPKQIHIQKQKKEKKINAKALSALKASLVRVEADPKVGLTKEQVQERIDKRCTNVQPNVITKSYFQIFRSNLLTLFNFVNIFLASAVLIYGNVKNVLFIGLVVANAVIGVFQEIRAKLTLEKMSLLTAPSVDVVRHGETLHLPISDIVLDDVIVLRQGSQVPTDCVVLDGMCEANESLLTGEQDDIHKAKGAEMLSGSMVQAGEVRCRVTAVGEDSYSSKLLAEAKKFKKQKSELMKSINYIIRIVTIIIFPLGIMMFFNNLSVNNGEMNATVTNTVASIVGMIPEGLVALTSVALATGVYKLSKKQTLVQELYSIETLARVDVLCLDKTGTITEGSMQVEQVHVYSSKYGLIDDIVGNMVETLGDQGATFAAFKEYFHYNEKFEAQKNIPFSSARKWSAVDFKDKGRFIVGAPEFVLKDKYYLVENDAKEYTAQGYRVLVLATTTEALNETLNPDKIKPVALIILSDKIRENATKTFEYFAKQGVALKVISGDNPLTVSKVAERAGLIGAEKYIDASTDLLTEEQIYDACDKYTIFGRVSPKQKKQLVKALKSKGYTVGMTGDGVNDVMALKEADCSIAMASGSEAARNVSQLVLLNSDFASLPSVVAEGRRVINNIERAASLFLVKTTFSALLSILMVVFKLSYPFEPIQLTLVSTLFVGLPSFFLALEPNDTKVSGNFLSKVFKKALPAGFTISFLVFIICYMYSDIGINVSGQIGTMSCYIYGFVSFAVLAQVCLPYNKERLFLIAICLIAFIWCVTVQFTRTIFGLVPLTSDMTFTAIILTICIIPTIIFMRVEIEAFRTLFKEFVDIGKRGYNIAKSIFRKNKSGENK